MHFVSWNVNGLRAVCGKGFSDIFNGFDADFVCLQETKLQEGQIDLSFDGYESFWNYAERKGYSGTVIFTKHKPLAVTTGIGIAEHDTEGRIVTLDMGKFYLVNVYTPNAQPELARLEYRMNWELEFMNYLKRLDAEKPVIVCGDMNVAHNEIDLRNPKTNHGNPGFSDEERACMTRLLEAGFVDTFRYLYPDKADAYSWWSYRGRAREKNVGWRIDYFLVSQRLAAQIQKAEIYADILGSDHCPVSLTLDI
jgi:exodeoxyribonuclease-3